MSRPFLLVALLVAGAAFSGCASPGPAPAPRTQTLVVTFMNLPDQEFGDLMAERMSVSYSVAETSDSFTLAPRESRTIVVDVASLDAFPLEHQAGALGREVRGTLPFAQDACGGQETVHVALRYWSKLVAGAWEWGGDGSHDCPASAGA